MESVIIFAGLVASELVGLGSFLLLGFVAVRTGKAMWYESTRAVGLLVIGIAFSLGGAVILNTTLGMSILSVLGTWALISVLTAVASHLLKRGSHWTGLLKAGLLDLDRGTLYFGRPARHVGAKRHHMGQLSLFPVIVGSLVFIRMLHLNVYNKGSVVAVAFLLCGLLLCVVSWSQCGLTALMIMRWEAKSQRSILAA